MTTLVPRTRVTSTGDTRVTSTGDTRITSMSDVLVEGTIGVAGALTTLKMFTKALAATIGISGSLSTTSTFYRALSGVIGIAGSLSASLSIMAFQVRMLLPKALSALKLDKSFPVKKTEKSGTIQIIED